MSIGLEIRLHKHVTCTKAYEQCLKWDCLMLSLLCLLLFFFYQWFIQSKWDNSYPSFGLALKPYSNLILSHASFITFLLTMSNLVLYLLQCPPNINMWIVLQFGYPWVRSQIPLLMLVIDTMQSPICDTNIDCNPRAKWHLICAYFHMKHI